MFRHNICNHFDDEMMFKKQKYKSFALSIWLLFNTTRLLINIYYFRNGRVPIYLGDILREIGGLTVYYYFEALMASLLALRIVHLFNKKEMVQNFDSFKRDRIYQIYWY
jgi:hypothetical protein